MKKLFKKITVVALAAILAASLAACGGDQGGSDPAPSGSAAGENVAAGTITEGTIDLPCTGTNNSYADMHQAFVDNIAANTDGRFTGTVYPGGQLGTEEETFQGVINGTYKINCVSTAAQNSYISATSYFNMPFLYDSLDDVMASLDGLKAELQEDYEAAGVHLLALNINGFRQLTSNKEINTIDDLKGLKIRTMDAPLQIEMWKALGTNPTPISFGELYLALQQGTVDAQENPLTTIGAVNLYEQQKYVYLTNHMVQFNALTINLEFWNSLSAEDQAAFEKAAMDAADAMNKAVAEEDAHWTGVFEEAGLKVVTPDAKFVADCRKDTEGIADQIKASMDADKFDALDAVCRK